jgi:hypothetical protein
LDYSRQKQSVDIQETVVTTIVVKGSFILTNLTDDVTRLGDSPIAHGSFSNVWKGTWVQEKQIPKIVKLDRFFSSSNAANFRLP